MKQMNKQLLMLACAGLVSSPLVFGASFNQLECVVDENTDTTSNVTGQPTIDLAAAIVAAKKEQKDECKANPTACGIFPADLDRVVDTNDPNDPTVPPTTSTPTGNTTPTAEVVATPISTYCTAEDANHCGVEPEHIQPLVKEYCAISPLGNCGISQETILGSPNRGETEPNNHQQTADFVSATLNIVRGQLATSVDKDYFVYPIDNQSVTNPANTVFAKTLIVTLSQSKIAAWRVSVLDQAGNLLTASESLINADDDFRLETTIPTISTTKLNYFVVVEAASTESIGKPYDISIGVKDALNEQEGLALNIHDSETEPNNFFKEADELSSGIDVVGSLALGSFKLPGATPRGLETLAVDTPNIDGRLATPRENFLRLTGNGSTRDVDIYKFTVNGDETVNITLCAENTPCFENRKTWAAFVFSVVESDPRVNSIQDLEDIRKISILDAIGDSSFDGDGNPGTVALDTWQFYIQAYEGAYGESLIASIDPIFGDRNTLDFGIGELQKGTYYIVIAQVDERFGGTFLKAQETSKLPDPVFIVENPKSDDEYYLRLTKTFLTPNIEQTKANKVQAKFGDKGILTIPEVKVGNEVYSGELELVPNSNPLLFKLNKVNNVPNPISR